MKIKQLLENDHSEYFELIIKSPFFKRNIKHLFDDTEDYMEIHEDLKNHLIYHGTESRKNFVVVDLKDRSKPRDTSPLIHSFVNRLSEEKLGVKIRNKFFVYSSPYKVTDYGEPHIVFPLGKYTLYYSNVDDMTMDLSGANINSPGATYSETYVYSLLEHYKNSLRVMDLEDYADILSRPLLTALMQYEKDNSIEIDNIDSYLPAIKQTISDALELSIDNMEKDDLEKESEKLSNIFADSVENSLKRFRNYVSEFKSTQYVPDLSIEIPDPETLLDTGEVLLISEFGQLEELFNYYKLHYDGS